MIEPPEFMTLDLSGLNLSAVLEIFDCLVPVCFQSLDGLFYCLCSDYVFLQKRIKCFGLVPQVEIGWCVKLFEAYNILLYPSSTAARWAVQPVDLVSMEDLSIFLRVPIICAVCPSF